MAPRTRAAAAGDKRRCLVTGGSGFVGRHLVEQVGCGMHLQTAAVLWRDGHVRHWSAAAVAVMLPLLLTCTPGHHLLPHPPLHPLHHPMPQLLDSGRWDVTVFDIRAVEGESRAEYIVGDLRDAAQVAAACKGAARG